MNIMKIVSQPVFVRPVVIIQSTKTWLLGLMLAAGTAVSVRAQGELASGNVAGSGSGPYTYDLTFSNDASATSPIGSIWYAWIPGYFFLPDTPTGSSAPTGWTATIAANSIQFTADSPAYYLLAGQSLSGFSFQATFTPDQLAAAPDSGESVAYLAGLFSDSGDAFNVQPVPEPSAWALLALGAAGWCVAAGRAGFPGRQHVRPIRL